jgi:nucleoside-diphosphate-sugar epimerase
LRILISGAAGNLGSHVSRHLATTPHQLRLLIYKSPLPFDIVNHSNVEVLRADLGQPNSLLEVCAGVDCVVHFAGVLFAPLPETFLPKTNVTYVKNLVSVAKDAGVRKFVLISFPHVEGESDPDHRAMGRLDRPSKVIHFRTRLEAENYLLEACRGTAMAPVVFRAGIVYGPRIKLIQAACWMLRHRLMAIWKKPTWAHLIALPDFLSALQSVVENQTASGIYQICDDYPITLQDFLDQLADHFGFPRPWRLPAPVFHIAGFGVEVAALILDRPAPLNRDIVRAGMTSCVADTSRMKRELLPTLAYPTTKQGISLL